MLPLLCLEVSMQEHAQVLQLIHDFMVYVRYPRINYMDPLIRLLLSIHDLSQSSDSIYIYVDSAFLRVLALLRCSWLQ